jgi:SAM-dependent methyltransferase
MMGKFLNAGCGGNVLQGFVNLDFHPGNGVDIVADLDNCKNVRLPFGDEEFSFIYLSHTLEHLENPLPLAFEFWRISKPGAVLRIRIPHHSSDDAWIDPTHKRPWHWRSFTYFSSPKYHSFYYGYDGDWQPIKILLGLRKERLDVLKSHDKIDIQELEEKKNFFDETIVDLLCFKPSRPRKKYFFHRPELRIVEYPHSPSVEDVARAYERDNLGKKFCYFDPEVVQEEASQSTHGVDLPECRVIWNGKNSTVLAAENVDSVESTKVELRDASVLGGTLTAVDSQKRLHRSGYSFGNNWLLKDYAFSFPCTVHQRFDELPRLECAAIFGPVDHFGHFFVDVLDKFATVGQYDNYDKLLVSGRLAPFVEEFLALGGMTSLKGKFLQVQKGQILEVSKLDFWTGRSNKRCWSPITVDFIREVFRGALRSNADGVYFVTRESAPKRKFRNLEKLRRKLEPLGVEFIDTNTLSVKEQIARFSGGRLVIGAIGSDLFNLLWAPSGCRVIAMANRSYLKSSGDTVSFLRSLCAIRGLSLTLVAADTESESPSYDDDLSVDEDLLAGLVEAGS